MKYHCTKCHNAFSLDQAEKMGGRYIFRCEKCGEVVIVVDPDDMSKLEDFLLNDNELDYLIHLVRKQKNKVAGAFNQLERTEQKLLIQQELMKETK